MVNMRKEYGRDKKFWTKREEEYVKKYYASKTIEEIAKTLHRPPNGVIWKVEQLNSKVYK